MAIVKRETSEYFNPRPRKEGDRSGDPTWRAIALISIHALAKRATEGYSTYKRVSEISIHALVKRATKEVFCMINAQKISIHALVKRATLHQQAL